MVSLPITKSERPDAAGIPTSQLTLALQHQDNAAELAQVVGRKCGFCAWINSDPTSGIDMSASHDFACSRMKRRRIQKHGSLAREGEQLRNLYSLRFGQIKVVAKEHDAHHVTGFRMPGDLIGLESVETGLHRFQLLALEDSEVCEFPIAALVETMAQQATVRKTILSAFTYVLDETYHRASILSMRSLERRFAAFLLWLSMKYARIGYSGISFRLLMTRGDIGSYLATSVESISRLIARFNSDGAALIRGRTVDIIDRPYLEALARGDGKFD